jgi:mitogen-activated protein kinase kinase kinase
VIKSRSFRFLNIHLANKWIKGALIGAGSFGKVYLGMDASTGLLMAVKQVELPTGSASNQERKKSMLTALEREIELLQDLQHENIVQYLCMSPFTTFDFFNLACL